MLDTAFIVCEHFSNIVNNVTDSLSGSDMPLNFGLRITIGQIKYSLAHSPPGNLNVRGKL
jgi:hypothetical protein